MDDIVYIQRGYERFRGEAAEAWAPSIEKVSTEKEIRKFMLKVSLEDLLERERAGSENSRLTSGRQMSVNCSYSSLTGYRNKRIKNNFSYSERWRYKGSVKLRQPRATEGANLSERSNNKRICCVIITVRLLRSGLLFCPVGRESPDRELRQWIPAGYEITFQHAQEMKGERKGEDYGKKIIYIRVRNRRTSGQNVRCRFPTPSWMPSWSRIP